MPIKRSDINESEEDRATREAEEQASREAAEASDQERKAELDSIREERRQAQLEAAAAKGEAEALRRGVGPTQQPQWTDDQWENEGAKRGMTGQQFKAAAELAAGITNHKAQELQAEINSAKQAAAEAKAETAKLRTQKGRGDVEADFFDKNPGLKAHRKHVDEFLQSYPDHENVDGDTLKKRLALATDIVKGRVKENMRTSKPGETGSSRFEGSDEREERETSPDAPREFDPRGTGNLGAAQLMERVNHNFGRDLRHEDSIDVWKKSLDEEGRGVSMSMDEDLARARALSSRDKIGGKRGS